MVVMARGMVERVREGVHHPHLRRLATEGRRPNGCRSFEPTAVWSPESMKVNQTLLWP